jgi:hypothetical protein
MHYLDTAQDFADRAARTCRANAAAQRGHDARRHDDASAPAGCTVRTWHNTETDRFGCDVMNAGRRVAGGRGWRTDAEAMTAGLAMIEEAA